MDITNKPGPTSKRKYKFGFRFNYKIISAVAIFWVLFPKIHAQSLNDLNCEGQKLCYGDRFEIPYPRCKNNTCSCRAGYCIHFTTLQNDYYDYYCGECGTIGSICTNDIKCQQPGECRSGFCKCRGGDLVDSVCLRFEPITSSTGSIILISILIFLLLLNKVIVSFEAIKKAFWAIIRCQCCRRGEQSDQDTAYGYNEGGREKSPAYTISSRDFISTSDDPDLEWALELSAELARTEVARRSLSDSIRFTQRNRRYRMRSQLISSSTNSSIRSSSSSFSTPISSRNSTLYGTARQTPGPSGRRRGFYSLFQEHENRGEEVILTRILNHRSRQPSDTSEEQTETAFHSLTSGTSSSSPTSIKRMSLSSEGTSGNEEHQSITREDLQSFRRSETSKSDFASTNSSI